MGMTNTIIANKAGFVEHLRERANGDRVVAEDRHKVLSQRERRYYEGRAEGLGLAAMLVEQWELPSS